LLLGAARARAEAWKHISGDVEKAAVACCLESGAGADVLMAWVRCERFMCRHRLHEEPCCLKARLANRGIVVVRLVILAGLLACVLGQQGCGVEGTEYNVLID